MVHSENNKLSENGQSENGFEDSPTRESIREWRSSVETFFSENWKQVGQMITSLENSLWENSTTTVAEESRAQNYPAKENCNAQLDATSKPRVPVSSDSEQKMRLETLAQKIEERLSHADQD
jgi:hypothetical protein